MENDAQTPRRQPNFLFRQVVVPSWLQVILLIGYVYAFIHLLVINPALTFIVFAASIAFGALVIYPLRRCVGQASRIDDDKEVKTAPNQHVAASIRWRQIRTYQAWHLTILIVVTAGVLLDAAGIPTP